jgi:hypothetical protein
VVAVAVVAVAVVVILEHAPHKDDPIECFSVDGFYSRLCRPRFELLPIRKEVAVLLALQISTTEAFEPQNSCF